MTLTLHPLARTTPRTRAELKAEDPNLSHHALAKRYGVTRKWRERDSTADRSHRPDTLHCTLTPAQEAVAMTIRRMLWLPLDDLLVVVREFLNPKVSRSGVLSTVRMALPDTPAPCFSEKPALTHTLPNRSGPLLALIRGHAAVLSCHF
ncbi:MAG: hypothetical protein ABI114_01795 [Rhodanobacter sp.]